MFPFRSFAALLQWFAALSLACAVSPALAGHRLEASVSGSRLEGKVEYLIDATQRRQLADVLSPEVQAAFVEPTGPLRTGLDTRPFWLRITLEQHGRAGDWLLALPTTAIEELEFYGPFDEGRALADPVRTGLTHSYDSRPLSNERYVFRVLLPREGRFTAYLRVVSRTSKSLDLTVWDPPNYLASRQDKRLFDGLAYGILLTLLIYNLVLAIILRDRTYGLYVLNCTFALLTIASFNGHAARYLFPDWPRAIELSNVVTPSLWMMCGALFARNFLELPGRWPKLNRVSLVVVALALLALVPGLTGQVSVAQRFNEALSIGGIAFFVVASLAVGLGGYRPARWYLAGQAMVFLAAFSIVLASWWGLDWPFMIANGLQLGILVEMVVFSIALSSRIRLIQAQKIALQERAGRLAVAARTDPLTGLANRTGLLATADQLLSEDGPHGLMMIDLDRFKPVNDEFGHKVGDGVLVELAHRIAAAVRPVDIVARLGGDEFVVLLAGTGDRSVLEAQARRIRSVVQEPVTFAEGVAMLDCSVGVALYPEDGRVLDELLARADERMYAEKAGHAARQGSGTAAPAQSLH